MSANDSNARQIEKRLGELQKLVSLVSDINRHSLDLDQMLHVSLQGIQNITGGKWSCAILVDASFRSARIAHSIGLDQELAAVLENLEISPEDLSTEFGRMPGVSKLGQTISDVLRSLNLQWYIQIPLVSASSPMGVMIVDMPTSLMPDPPSVDMLMAIGEQIGRAAENARLHAQLRESERWSHAFINNSPDGFVERDHNRRITFANEGACRILECSHDELLGAYMDDYLYDREQVKAYTEQLMQDGFVVNKDFRARTKTGKLVMLNGSSRLIMTSQGQVTGVQTIFRDITQYQNLLTTVQCQNETLTALNSIAGILSHPLDVHRALDQVCMKLAEITSMESVGITLKDETQPCVRLANYVGLNDTMSGMLAVLRLDDPIIHKIAVEGQVFALDNIDQSEHVSMEGPRREGYRAVVAVPILQTNQIVGILAAGTRQFIAYNQSDVDLLMNVGRQIGTALENAHLYLKLRESEQWSHTFLEHSPDGIWERDTKGNLTFINKTGCELLESSLEELIGKPPPGLQVSSSQVEQLRTTLIERGSFSDIRIPYRTLHGSTKILSFTTRLVRNPNGEITGSQSIFRDVTERVYQTELIQRQNEALTALNGISEILSSPLDLTRSLTQVCEQLTRITHMETVGLILNDADGKFGHLVAHSGMSDSLAQQLQNLGLDDAVTRHVLADGNEIALNDVEQYVEIGFAGPRAEGYHAGILLPILKDGKPIGAFGAGSKKIQAYESSDLDILRNASRQVARALENAELYAKMQARMAELDGLAQLSTACTSTLELNEICQTVVRQTCKMLHADLCTLRLIKDENIVLAAIYPSDKKTPIGKSIPVDMFLNDTLRKLEPFVANDLHADTQTPESSRNQTLQSGLQSMVIMPLASRNHSLGTLNVLQAQPRMWQANEIDLIKTIANQVSNAINNAQLFNQILTEQRKVQAIFDSGLSGLYATDVNGCMIMFNRAAERITGWKSDEVFGKTWNQVFCCNQPDQKTEPLINEALERRQTAYVMDGRKISTRDGRTIIVSEAVAPLLNDQEQIVGAVGAFWDLTREKQAEVTQKQILTLVAHQLRSPLTAVLSAVEMLENSNLSKAKQKEMWQVIKQDAERLRYFANDFLTQQSILNQEREPNFEPLSIAVLVRDLVIRLKTSAPEHHFKIDCMTPEPIVLADASAAQDVLRNLLDNAVHYSPNGTTITTIIEPYDDSMIDISVHDEGRGIPYEDISKVFEPFCQSNRDHAQRSQYGHGLGLAIAKQAVEQMGGKIWITPSDQPGTTIHFTLRRSA